MAISSKKNFRVTRFFKKTSKIANFSKKKNQSYQTENPKVAKNFQKKPKFPKIRQIIGSQMPLFV